MSVKQSDEINKLSVLAKFAFDNAPDPILWLKSDSSIIYVNDYACEMLGYSHEEMEKMSVADFDPVYTKDHWPEFLNRMEKKELLTFETTWRAKDNTQFPVEVSARYLANGGEKYFIAFVRDISERNKIADELVEKNKSLKELTYACSHSLKSPINATGKQAGLLLKYLDKKPERVKECAEMIVSLCASMKELVDSNLDACQDGSLKVDVKLIETNKVLDRVISMSRSINTETLINLSKLPNIYADEHKLADMVSNLISNSCKYNTNRNKEVDIFWDDEKSAIVVSDNGVGMSEEEVSMIFEANVRFKPEMAAGHGLGMATVKTSVNLHKWEIDIQSEPDKGTIVIIRGIKKGNG